MISEPSIRRWTSVDGSRLMNNRPRQISQQGLETEHAVVDHACQRLGHAFAAASGIRPARAAHSRTATPTAYGPSPSDSAAHRPQADLDDGAGGDRTHDRRIESPLSCVLSVHRVYPLVTANMHIHGGSWESGELQLKLGFPGRFTSGREGCASRAVSGAFLPVHFDSA